MFDRIINKLAGDYNQKQIDAIQPLVQQINTLYAEWDSLSDEQIQAKTGEFQSRLAAGETTDDLLVEAFATVKQACKRMMGQEIEVKGETLTREMIPYDVQLVGGIIIHQGKMAEMRTGEGKTLVATLPCYLNALTGKGVHVVTVNDYLASRDAEWMWHLYNRLWLTVWSVVKWSPLQWRREQYEKDITYVENSELGFDYLRDNLAKTLDERNMLWRPMHYAIVDEVDSILIDEARTPLIISQASGEPTEKYAYYAQIVKSLIPSKGKKKISKWFLAELMKDAKWEEEQADDGGDYYIDEKTRSATLSSAGIAKLEKMLNVENLYKDIWFTEIHHIENALKAQAVYNKDKEYLVRDGQVMIVDDNTGRVMPGRRFSQWLHQAIEAKEKVEIKRESRTLASITYQHFFKQYEKLSGMTGTALTEAEEFESIYESETVTIPTNKPILRVDKSDAVYFNQKAKRDAVTDHIQFYHKMWLPILIGTSSIQTSEFVSKLLDSSRLIHNVLNAKFHESEANIVKNAGKKWSIMVATNMAGRGTDIKLDASLSADIAKNYAKWFEKGSQKSEETSDEVRWKLVWNVYSDVEFVRLETALQELWVVYEVKTNSAKKAPEDRYAKITVGSGGETEERDIHFGLFILGTEKHESRRIDNQLRWRAGRQGDPGVSQFFVALDDEIMRKMWWDKIQGIAKMMMKQEELEQMAFTQKQFTDSIERAQKQMEGRHYGIRKQLFEYDTVINKQRAKVYEKRDAILFGQEISERLDNDDISNPETILDEVREFLDLTVQSLVTNYASNPAELSESLAQITGVVYPEEDLANYKSESKLTAFLGDSLHSMYDTKFADIEIDNAKLYVKRIYLSVIDKYWMEHIDEMSYLREKVSLRSYAQQDPLVIYKKEAYGKFQSLLSIIKKDTLSNVMKSDFAGYENAQQAAQQVQQQSNTRDINMMEVLKQVAWSAPVAAPATQNTQQTKQIQWWWSAKVLKENDEFEVLEVSDESAIPDAIIPQRKKLRPNDKVNVQHPDGKIEYGVKRKKVKDQVEAWELKLA